MKKIFSLFAAVMLSVSIFAAAPTKVVPSKYLTDNYDCSNNYVVAIWYDMNLTCVPDPFAMWTGTYNSWDNKPVAGNVFAEVLTGEYEGWIVFVVPFTSGAKNEGKPLVLDQEGNGGWDYQPGVPATWVNQGDEGAKEATIVVGGMNTAESDVTWPDAGPYVYEITGLKNDANPCTAVYHNYTIKVYVPEFCEAAQGEGFNYEDSVHIDGSFDSWGGGQFMAYDVDTAFETYYYINLKKAKEGTEFLIRLGTANYDDKISGNSNIVLDSIEEVTYIFRDKPWTMCATAQEFVVNLKTPAFCTDLALYADSVQIVGDFDGWSGTLMTKVSEGNYTATVTANPGSGYKFKAGSGWDREIMDGDVALGNESFPTAAGTVEKDYSANNYYWKGCATAIPEIKVEAGVAKKVIINGQIVIVKDGAFYNLLGSEMK